MFFWPGLMTMRDHVVAGGRVGSDWGHHWQFNTRELYMCLGVRRKCCFPLDPSLFIVHPDALAKKASSEIASWKKVQIIVVLKWPLREPLQESSVCIYMAIRVRGALNGLCLSTQIHRTRMYKHCLSVTIETVLLLLCDAGTALSVCESSLVSVLLLWVSSGVT